MKKLFPINKNIILKKVILNRHSKIILPLSIEKKSYLGKILYLPTGLKIYKKLRLGDIVVYSKYSINKLNLLGNKYLYVKYKDIILIIK